MTAPRSWYLTRASGVVALILLTATVVVGVVASVGWSRERWPRFLFQHLHRNLSLLCLAFVAVHVVTTIGDGYVPIGALDAFVPFRSPYRPLWVGLGAVSLDFLVAVLLTSALRHRIGYGSWRSIHWLAYACWPIAVLHGLGTGSDTSLEPVLVVDAVCAAAVLGVVAWRLATATAFGGAQRLTAGLLALAVAVAIAVVAVLGPLRPGWSRRSGTASALLAQIAAVSPGTREAAPPAPPSAARTSTTQGSDPSSGYVPPAPFSFAVRGTQVTAPMAAGKERITLALHLDDPAVTPLTVELQGGEVPGGGVSLTSGSVEFGPFRGTVTSLDGDRVAALVPDGGPLYLTVTLRVDEGTGVLSGVAVGNRGGG